MCIFRLYLVYVLIFFTANLVYYKREAYDMTESPEPREQTGVQEKLPIFITNI